MKRLPWKGPRDSYRKLSLTSRNSFLAEVIPALHDRFENCTFNPLPSDIPNETDAPYFSPDFRFKIPKLSLY